MLKPLGCFHKDVLSSSGDGDQTWRSEVTSIHKEQGQEMNVKAVGEDLKWQTAQHSTQEEERVCNRCVTQDDR